MRAGRWLTDHALTGVALLVLVYMFLPIFFVVLMSFNDPESTGLHQWYGWQDPHRLRRRWEEECCATETSVRSMSSSSGSARRAAPRRSRRKTWVPRR